MKKLFWILVFLLPTLIPFVIWLILYLLNYPYMHFDKNGLMNCLGVVVFFNALFYGIGLVAHIEKN